MPFPSGISVPQAYNEILAYDNDIGTNDIQFTLSGAGSEYFDVSWTAVVGTDLKIRYSADIIAKNHLYLDVPLSLTITAKGMGGGDPGTELNTTASISIDIDTDNSEDPVIVPTAFKEQIYYSQEAVDESTPVGTIATTVPMEIENAKDEVDYDITVTTPVGGATIPVDLFSADYDTTNKSVTLSLSRALSAEEGLNEIFTLRLEAKDPSDIEFLAETIVYVDVRAIDGSFESDLYVSNIDDPDMETTVPLVTDPVEIKIISVPSDNIIVTLEKPYSNAVWVEDQFVAEYVTGGVVVIKLNQKLTEDALKLPSINLLLKISFSNNLYTAEILSPGMQSGVLETSPEIILSNCVSTDTVDLVQQDGLPFWDDQFSNVIDHVISPHEEIKFKETPTGTVTVELKTAPGNALSFPENYAATYDTGADIVTIKLIQVLSGDALSAEVHVMTLAASVDGILQSETLIYIDIIPTSIPPPVVEGEFNSALYTSEITDPSTPQELDTIGAINIAQPPSDVVVTLEAAPESIPSYVENFAITQPDANGNIVLSLETPLPPDASENSYLVLILHAESASIDDYFEESVIHVKLPDVVCSITTTTCPSWASCPPCTCTTPLPSGSITFDQATYITTTAHDTIENTGQLNITKDSDLEALLQIQNNPQVYVEMTVDCEDPTAVPMSIHLLPREIPPEISITRQEMVVVITLEDKNDQNPIFEISELAVAYPILDLARQLLPGPIAAVTATDEDSSDKALSYSLATINEKYSVHPETGKLYPVDGIYNYVDETVYVAAFDSANNRAEIKYHLRHVTHNEIATVTILGAWLEDEETILEYIATNSPDYTWGSLKSAVLAEPPSKQITPELQSRLLRSAERAGNTGGMFLVLYAINEKLKPVPYDELVKLLEELPPSENWQVSAVETWEQSTAHYATYCSYRKKQKEKLRAKAGFKNRTSFSNQGVLENGKAPHHDDHSIHEDGLKLPETMSEQEERRKSMVTFSDEPEVIPGQSAAYMGPLDLSIDGVHRALTWGFQVGVLGYVLTWVTSLLRITSMCPCLAFVLCLIFGTAVAAMIARLEVVTEGKAVLITGCDSGFGYHLALRLEKMGFVVFAGCLNAAGAKQLVKEGGNNLVAVQLNVTSEEDIVKAQQHISDVLSERRIHGLWGVVNNAGLSTFGTIEWIPEADSRRVMEVNVWGMVRVTRAFLPLIRQAKGRVVNVASALGRFSNIGRSSYGMTKHAVEAFSDILRFEMRKFGIKVSIVEPGNFVNATSIFSPESIKKHSDHMWQAMAEEVRHAYGQQYYEDFFRNMIYYSTKGPTDLEPALVCLTQPIVQTFPAPRYQPMDLNWKIRCLVQTHLPEWVYERIYII
ncbi:hypothetical protein B566_EDAN016300 [Ephemera danica]|nr:hypothetical protein B566_EDAN016300 [Ephemera danica]